MAQLDVFSLAASIIALLIAAGFAIAFWVNRRLVAFPWWAATFVLLAFAIVTATLRFDGPSHWIKALSWAAFYASASLVALGLYRVGATRTNPFWAILACAILYLGVAAALIATLAPPHFWFLLGPVPTLVFMTWALVPMLRARAWIYAGALSAGITFIALRAIWFTTDLMRMGPVRRPVLRGGLAPDGLPSDGPPLGRLNGAEGVISLRPPPGGRAPIEQPLTIVLLTIAAILGLALVLILRDVLASVSRMRERSTTDAMTGLLNRATFDEEAQAALAANRRLPVCVVLFDIDHFKRINDTCGHLVGDQVIARLGRLIAAQGDHRAIAGRIGGEEFAVLLPDCNLSAARLFAETVRAQFSQGDPGEHIGWAATLSAGLAMRDGAEPLTALMSRADKALYVAKDRGRDQVAIAADMAERQMPRARRGIPA